MYSSATSSSLGKDPILKKSFTIWTKRTATYHHKLLNPKQTYDMNADWIPGSGLGVRPLNEIANNVGGITCMYLYGLSCVILFYTWMYMTNGSL